MSLQHRAWRHPRHRVRALLLRLRPDLLGRPRTRHNGRQTFGADVLWASTLAAMNEKSHPSDRTPFEHLLRA